MHQIPLSSSIKDKQDKTLWRSFRVHYKKKVSASQQESSERLNLFPKTSSTKITHKFMDIVLLRQLALTSMEFKLDSAEYCQAQHK